MKKVLLLSLAVVLIFSGQAMAQDMKREEAMKQPALVNAKTPEAKLVVINKMVEEKKIRSSTLSEYIHRLWWEVIAPEKTILDKINKYATVKAKNPKLSTNYDFEQSLIMIYFAEDPVASKADYVKKMQLLKTMQENKKVSWPAAAPFYTALIAIHLAGNPEFQKMSGKDKIVYLKKLEAEGTYGSISDSRYSKEKDNFKVSVFANQYDLKNIIGQMDNSCGSNSHFYREK